MCPPISLPLRNARFLAATHIGYSPQARHDSVAQLFSLVATDGTCESNNWYNLPCRVRRPRRTACSLSAPCIAAGAAIDRPLPYPIPNKNNAEAGKAIFPASAVPGKTILAISSVVRGLPKRMIYFSSSVQSRASRMVVHFSYLSSLLLSEYAWLLVASCTAR